MTQPTVMVLRRGVHGLPMADYAAAIRDRLPETPVELAKTPAEERDLITDVEIVTGHGIDKSLLAAADELKLFAGIYAGVDHLPLEAMADRDVAVTNAAGVHGPNVAEHVLGSILVLATGQHIGWQRQQQREWRHYRAHELAGSTVTVVGLGPIGQAIIARLEGFEVDTIGVRYTPEKGGPADEIIGFNPAAFHAALAKTDYLVLACPLTDTTRQLIDAKAFHTLPPSAVLINIARGPIVDTDALIAAIQREDIRGAALDVTDPEPLPEDNPLWGLRNVLITPHRAGYTPHYYERVANILADNIRTIQETGEYVNLSNRVQ